MKKWKEIVAIGDVLIGEGPVRHRAGDRACGSTPRANSSGRLVHTRQRNRWLHLFAAALLPDLAIAVSALAILGEVIAQVSGIGWSREQAEGWHGQGDHPKHECRYLHLEVLSRLDKLLIAPLRSRRLRRRMTSLIGVKDFSNEHLSHTSHSILTKKSECAQTPSHFRHTASFGASALTANQKTNRWRGILLVAPKACYARVSEVGRDCLNSICQLIAISTVQRSGVIDCWQQTIKVDGPRLV
jgi:hypothetical protein